MNNQSILNEALSLVYDLQDASNGVSADLEKIIFNLVDTIEQMVDSNDDMLEGLK